MKQVKLRILSIKTSISFIQLSRWLLPTILLAIAYWIGGKLGLLVALPVPPGNVTAVWPPSPIAWAAMLLLGYKVWPGIWLGDILVNTSGYFDASRDLLKSIIIAGGSAIGSTLEAILGAFLIQRFIGCDRIWSRAQNVFKFLLISAFCPTISATLGIACLCIGGISTWADFKSLWYTWWIGNTVTLLVLMPLLLVWQEKPKVPNKTQDRVRSGISLIKRWWHRLSWRIVAESFLGLGLLLYVNHLAFNRNYPIEYLFIPCLVWIAFRFKQKGVAIAIALVSALAVWATSHGVGSFIRQSPSESMGFLQAFMGVVSITTLLLVAVLTENQEAEAELKRANEQLTIEIDERQQVEIALRNSEEIARKQAERLAETLHELHQAQAQLIHTEKLSSVGQLVAGIAHEINNPVNFIYGNLTYVSEYTKYLLGLIWLYQQEYPNTKSQIQELIKEGDLEFINEDLPKTLSSMKVGAERIRDIILTLKNFSRLDESEMKPVNIHEGIDSTILILQNRLRSKPDRSGIQIVKKYGDLPQVECYAGQLNQVFMNILCNAIDALHVYNKQRASQDIETRPSQIEVETSVIEDNWVRIRFKDNGPGMTEAETLGSRTNRPFMASKSEESGTGVELSISNQIDRIVVEKHGGRLLCRSEAGQGTEFVLEIPTQQKLPAQSPIVDPLEDITGQLPIRS